MDSAFSPEELERFRALLLERKSEIESCLDSSAEAARPVELDGASIGRITRADALQQQAMAKATKNRMQLELQRIDAALRRIDGGTYGVCLRCEEPIPSRRLEVDPGATLCVNCAR